MKRYILWSMFALAAIAMALMPSAPTVAQTRSFHKTTALKAVGDEPGAKGHATMEATPVWTGYGYGYSYTVNFTCTGLTPGDYYEVDLPGFASYPSFGSVTLAADPQGGLTGDIRSVNPWKYLPTEISVYRQTASGYVLVLDGCF